ncbi:MAG: nitroreductase family protein [Arenicella sp.]|nr:nitroreductase family protein [Arenicella sp.]
MKFTEFAKSRKSTRGFLDKPVAKKVVDEIIDAAKWAPSSCNLTLFTSTPIFRITKQL